jgi:hypothetical protein
VTCFSHSSISISSLAIDAMMARSFTDRCKGDAADDNALRARCRLKQAKTWFAHRGWEVLPQTERGRRIIDWGADHAWLAASANPKRSVRRWCRRWAPWLSDAELNEIIAARETSNKRWSDDQCAAVLEISVKDREEHKLWDLGANDDPFNEKRKAIAKAKASARARCRRAKQSTGAKRGRPRLQLSEDDRLARRRAQSAERKRRYLERENPTRPLKIIGSATELSVPQPPVSVDPLAGPQAPARKAPSFDQPEPVAIERAASHGAVLSVRQQLQERARVLLNEVTAGMMRSADPVLWQPLFLAATREWSGHNLIDGHEEQRS